MKLTVFLNGEILSSLDYLKVVRFVNDIKVERVICLTAKATPRVGEDVRRAFDSKESNMFSTSPSLLEEA
jgi:superfamily II DNA helicase RecQ